MDFIRGIFRVLLTPSCWLQADSYSRFWDQELIRLMAQHRFEPIDRYTCTIGGVTVWVANHPYGSFNPYGTVVSVRPKRITILRAMDRYIQDVLSQPETNQ